MPEGVETAVRFDAGGIGLPEIVTEGGQHQTEGVGCPLAQGGGLIQNQQGVRPDIPLRVILRRLRNCNQFFQFGKPEVQLVHPAKLPEEHRGPFGLH